jgi:hypothetical protein
MANRIDTGARFYGTFADYHFHVGPSIRNMIQSMTKSKRFGTCAIPGCSYEGKLDAAHKLGRSRPYIVEEILKDYLQKGSDIVDCNLNVVFNRIKEAHSDFERTFNFICRPCHLAQDAKERRTSKKRPVGLVPTAVAGPEEPGGADVTVEMGTIPVQLSPASEDLFKAHLLLARRATVTQWFRDGRSSTQIWDARNFNSSSSLWANIRTHYARRKRCLELGIVRVDISVNPDDLPVSEQSHPSSEALA